MSADYVEAAHSQEITVKMEDAPSCAKLMPSILLQEDVPSELTQRPMREWSCDDVLQWSVEETAKFV